MVVLNSNLSSILQGKKGNVNIGKLEGQTKHKRLCTLTDKPEDLGREEVER